MSANPALNLSPSSLDPTLSILRPQPKSKPRPIIIFDWDDTLFFTSWLKKTPQGQKFAKTASDIRPGAYERAIAEMDPKTKADMFRYLKTVQELIARAQEEGTVFIVTNAQEGWVQYCIKYYAPSLDKCFGLSSNIRIISARTKFENEVSDPT